MIAGMNSYFFVIEQTDGSEKSKFIAEFRAENLKIAKQDYEEVLGWCGDYNVLQIIERNPNEPPGSGVLNALLVSSGNS